MVIFIEKSAYYTRVNMVIPCKRGGERRGKYGNPMQEGRGEKGVNTVIPCRRGGERRG